MSAVTRLLLIVAAAGLVLSVVCFTAAGRLGGAAPWRAAHYSWRLGPGWMGESRRFSFSEGGPDDAAPAASRTLAWSGGNRLEIDAPVDVDYTQGPVAAITATGPKAELDHLTVQNGRITLQGWPGDAAPLKIVMTAPAVTQFEVDGSQDLTVHGYQQDALAIHLAGSGDATVQGQALQTKLVIDGSGDADLGGLRNATTSVQLNGSGDAAIAPRKSADIHIAGSGRVLLLSHPASVNSDVTGSGSVSQPSRDDGQAA